MEAFLGGGSILLAVLGFAFVIFIHELGHFVFAKWAGVRVEVFSIGFGPVVWSRTIGDTRYALSLLPLGGYVRMLGHDEVSTRDNDEQTHPESFASKHPGWKAAILFGGVLFNLISSWLILVALAFYGMPHFPATVGEIQPSITTMIDGERQAVPSPAVQLGLQRGDRIIAVNDERVRDFEDMIFATLGVGTEPITLTVMRAGEAVELGGNDAEQVRPVYSISEGKVALGVNIARSLVLASSQTFGPQPQPELVSGWRLDAIAGEELGDVTGQQAEQLLLPHIGQEVELSWRQGAEERQHRLRYAGNNMDFAGLFGLPVSVAQVATASAAERAGMRQGDVILAIDGQAVSGSNHLRSLVNAAGDQALHIELLRPGNDGWEIQQLDFQPEWDTINQRYLIGIHMDAQGSGRLPETLPPALGSLPSPLAKAGVRGGSVLLDSRSKDGKSMHVRTLPPETQTRLIALSEEAWVAMDRFRTVAMISKLAGFRDTQALSQRLLGARVLATGPGQSGHPKPGWMQIEGADSDHRIIESAVDLNVLPAADRRTLLSIPEGSYIVNTSRSNDQGQRCLEIATVDEEVIPERHELTPAPIGTVLFFGIDERPYELQSMGEAFTLANHKSMQMITRTLALIPRFFQPGSEGGISAEKSLHGPIGIFSELKARLEHLGFPSFLRLVALIGLNLFLINLLPIPITDGGQLVILGVEVAIRRPIPEMILNVVNLLGFALIVMLMLFVIGNDLARQIFS